MIPEGLYLFPSRTEQSSPPGPMIVGPQGPAKVGRRGYSALKSFVPSSRPILRHSRESGNPEKNRKMRCVSVWIPGPSPRMTDKRDTCLRNATNSSANCSGSKPCIAKQECPLPQRPASWRIRIPRGRFRFNQWPLPKRPRLTPLPARVTQRLSAT